MRLRSYVVVLIAFCYAPALAAPDTNAVFSKFKEASGGSRWDSVRTLRRAGTLSAGGLSGEIQVTQDVLTGRSIEEYTLGPIAGASGYDGRIGWSRTPGGEVATLDAPEAVRRTRTGAWLNALGYWYPLRGAATYAAPETREREGKRYDVVVATPTDGDPVTLWFAADSHLLVRMERREGQYMSSTVLGDYREVDGLRLPFHSVTDLTDSAGRTDPRLRSEIRFEGIAVNVPVADADFAVPEMTAVARIDDASGVTRVPFDLVNNHIYIDGHIDGKPVRFLLDTGGVNLLTPAAAQKLGLKGEGKLAASGVGEERVDLAFARAGEVRVGEAALTQPVFYIIDLGKLESIEGVRFDGLVGYEMFRRFGVQIDYASRVLTIAEQDRFAPPEDATVVPFQLEDRIPIVRGKLDDLDVRIAIDTGSRLSLSLHAPFVRDHDLAARYRAAPESVLGWGVGGPSRGRPARLGTLRLGDLRIGGIVGDLATGNTGSAANPDLSGMLGGGVLRRFTLAFDYAGKRMYLAPNDAFGQPDTFDRSGLWLMADDDALEVADVAPESAAERAGVHVGDRIISIDGVAAAARSLDDWRRRLREQPAGTKLRLEIERAGRINGTTLVLADRVPAAGEHQ